ncbi:MAG: (4-O-methyl)-D-glucuronate---lignin esterase [Halanaerobiales bacterium]|nr:(4-O-methyl)-D-glucuronate---lignin esterase [Halanaerobiales bacterium]
MILDTRPLKQVTTLDNFTLIVTADNIGSYKKGAEKTKLYTKNALGNWKLDTFQGGELKHVNAPGIYETILSINDISKYKGKPCFLDLGEVHTVAEVKVNGKQAGTLMYSPYKLDISGYLKQGENIIEIKVTSRIMNRYIGFGLAYKNTTGAEQKTYQYYKEVSEVSTGWGGNSSSNYVDAGLLGPVCSIILKFIISLIFTGKNLYGL